MQRQKYRVIITALVLGLLSSLMPPLQAGDHGAGAAFQRALELSKQKDYRDAAKKFLEAQQLADSTAMKGKALREAMLNFRHAKLYYQEFQCIEGLLNSYPAQVNYASMVDREYQLGNIYFKGYREPAFWSFRWLPWLTAPDKTIKIYQQALQRAPFAKQAPQAQLRLARLYIDNGKINKSLELLRNLIKQHPNSSVTKYAYLELANALFQLSQKGDGDGKYNRETVRVLREFIKKYPRAPERDWVEKTLLKSKDIAAKRLYDLAKFYQHIGRTEPAKSYLNDVLTQYPDTTVVDQSEELLTAIDQQFTPSGFRPGLKSRLQKFQEKPLPKEYDPIMITPQASNGKWLLPIRDLGVGGKNVKISTLSKPDSSKENSDD